MSFPCTGCGACCKRIANLKDLINTTPELAFPYGWDESGRCEMLGEDNKCKVYESRPLICNVDRFIAVFKVPKKKFYKQNIEACHGMMKEDGIYERYQIKK